MITSIQTRASLPTVPGVEYSLAPDVIFVSVHDGSARLLDMGGQFYAVPPEGAFMLQETLAHGALAAAKRIADDYGVATGQVNDDLTAFIRELEAQGVLVRRHSRRRGQRASAGLARLFLRPALSWAHRVFHSPESKARALLGLARISFGLFGWTRTLAVWKEAHDRLVSRPPTGTDEQTVLAVDRAVRVAGAGHPFEVECKERALCCWALARGAGLHAAVVVGINLFPLAGHCWCEVGPWTLSDDQDRCAGYTPVGKW